MTPLVSIIIPCYNCEDLVADAIRSALLQTYPEVEVIVVDDGSTDSTLSRIRDFGEQVVISTGENRGGGAARNRGLALARGKYIQFLDADDVLFPSKLEVMVPISEKLDDACIAICDWEDEAGGGSPIRIRTAMCTGVDSVIFCLRRPLLISSPLHRRVLLKEIGGFNETLPCSQERDLHLRLAASGVKFTHVPSALYRVRRQPVSVSSSIVKVLNQHKAIFLGIHAKLVEQGTLSRDRRSAIAKALADDARRYVRLGMPDEAADYFSCARQVDRLAARSAFGRWYTRLIADVLGPVKAERLIQRLVSRN